MRILFQGDSITDADRIRDNITDMGLGYALLVKAELGFENPSKYEFINKGIGGNRIVDVYARIKDEIIELKPDVMSLLVGVNDVWHDLHEIPNGIDSEKFYKIYKMLVSEIKEALPDIKIMIMEPYVLKGTGTEAHWEWFREEVEKRAAVARRIAEEYGLIFIPLQKKLDDAEKVAPCEYWLRDGVHPTAMGHELIKREWIKAFNTL